MIDVIEFVPAIVATPDRVLEAPSAWKHLETILGDVVDRFCPKVDVAMDIGIDFGYSTVALSNFFRHVLGVDTFVGDIHSSIRPDYSLNTKQLLDKYPNITLVKSDWRQFAAIQPDAANFDCIHVDIQHTYQDTFDCGLWAAKHSSVTLFHDTVSFAEVMLAVKDVAERTGKKFYNYPNYCGLGILA